MNKNELKLMPSYWASVSGGKDSLYMLKLILHNLDKYPLTGVIHFELEIDYPFIKNVINYMESECVKHGIRFIRIKPKDSYWDLYKKHGNRLPSPKIRWCNAEYKLSCKKQFTEFQRSMGYETYYYIGLCADETKRLNRKTPVDIYPLADENITEETILEWAKTQPIFDNYYKINRRCGCMFCPMLTRKEIAYMAITYPEHYNKFIDLIRETEQNNNGKAFLDARNPKYNVNYLINNMSTKWIPKVREELDSYEK